MNRLVLIVVLPMLVAFLLPIIGRVSAGFARLLGPAVLLFNLWVIVSVWLATHGQPFSIALGGFAPPLGILFYVDHLALLFAFLVSLLGVLLWPYGNQTSLRQHALTLLLIAAASGLAVSGDLFNIYVFYELASVASFGLVAAAATPAARAAGIRYLIISGFGTVLALTGIALVYTQTGTLNLAQLSQLAPQQLNNPLGLAAFFMILLGVGVKAELFPVNTWVPEVYATASKRVSGLLAGLISKLAVLVLIRLLILVFQQAEALQILLVLGVLGVISGELAAWRAKDMERMLAYSSIGQLGVVFVAFSIPGEAGLYAGLAVALHHLIVKPALFLLAERWSGSLQALQGAAIVSPLGAGLLVLLALSLIGVPPLPGFWAKLLVVSGLAAQQAPMYLLAMLIILLATVLEANYFFRLVSRMYHPIADATVRPAQHNSVDLATASVFAASLVAVVVFITPLSDYFSILVQQAFDVRLYIDTVFPAVVAGQGL